MMGNTVGQGPPNKATYSDWQDGGGPWGRGEAGYGVGVATIRGPKGLPPQKGTRRSQVPWGLHWGRTHSACKGQMVGRGGDGTLQQVTRRKKKRGPSPW